MSSFCINYFFLQILIINIEIWNLIQKLQNEKKDLTSRLLSGEDVKNQIKQIEEKLIDAQEKMETLMSI